MSGIQEGGNRATVQTLGCKLNYAESSQLAAQFRSRGYEIGALSPETKVFFLNTCTVTQNAEKECRQIIRRVRRTAPDAFIAVTGCYAQLRPEEIASIDGVDLVLGAKEKFELFNHVGSFRKFDTPKIRSAEISEIDSFEIASSGIEGDRTRAFLKVQDGCDYNCSFCTIPMARGASRSAEIDQILQQARQLCCDGFSEIVLTGVNVGDFGKKTGTSFLELLSAIVGDEGITARIRISSIEPNLLSPEIIELVAQSEKMCPHFHIPLQSGSPTVLRRMQRRYTADLYRERVTMIKSQMPNAAIGVDVITGFPGESDPEFQETYQFLADLDIAYLHVFTYSERPGTKAAESGEVVAQSVRKDRTRQLRILSEKKRRAFCASQIGRVAIALIEHAVDSCTSSLTSQHQEGYAEQYVRVRLTEQVPTNAELVRVRLLEIAGDVMLAEPIAVLVERNQAVPSEFAFALPVLELAAS